MGAQPQHEDDGAEHQHDGQHGEEGARADALHGGGKRSLDRGAEALRLDLLVGIGLHRRHGVEDFACQRGSVGDAVLRIARELAHAAPEQHDGHDHRDQQAEDDGGQLGAGHEQHHQAAQEQQGVAQGQRNAGADHGLDQGGVGGQARQHFAGLGGLEELGALVDHVAVDGAADVGGDAFAQPGHHVEARRGRDPEHGRHAEQREEGGVDVADAVLAGGGAEAEVDHLLEGGGDGQGGAGREQQGDAGKGELAAVRTQEGQQALEGGEAALGGRRGGGGAGGTLGHRGACCCSVSWFIVSCRARSRSSRGSHDRQARRRARR